MTVNLHTTVAGIGNTRYQKPGNLFNPCMLRLDPCDPGECEPLDVLFVVRKSTGARWDEIKQALKDFGDRVAARYESAPSGLQIGLISIGDSAAIEQAFTTDVDAFKTAVDGMSTTAFATHAAMSWATEVALAQAWRPDIKKVLWVIGDARPSDEVAFEADASIAASVGIQANAISSTLASQLQSHRDEVTRTYTEFSIAGGGTFSEWPASIDTALDASLPDCESDQCCAEGVCDLCVTFIATGPPPVTYTDSATWDPVSGWYSATLNGATVYIFPTRDETDTCVFRVVESPDTILHDFPLCEVTCDNPTGSIGPVTIGGDSGTLSFEPYEWHRLYRKQGRRPGDCSADVVFIIDNEYRMGDGTLATMQASLIQPFVDSLETNFDSYRLSIITHDTAQAVEVLPFSKDNGSAFISAVNSLATTGDSDGDILTADTGRRSDLAFAMADGYTWTATNTRMVVFINGGNPGDTSPPVSGNQFELDQYSLATSLFGRKVLTHSIHVIYTTGTLTTEDVTLQTSTLGGGSHQQTSDLGAAVNALAQAAECKGVGECAESFCGNLECVPDKLCVTYSDADCTGAQGVLDWDATEECGLGWKDPKWSGDVVCGQITKAIEVELKRDANGDCVLSATAAGVDLGDVLISPLSKRDVSGSWSSPPVDMSVYPAICGICESPALLECCDFAVEGKQCPNLLTAEFCGGSIDLTLNAVGGCNDWTGSDPVSGEQIDIRVHCDPTPDPAEGDYVLELNCNTLGPNPVSARANFISCGPNTFAIVFDIAFNCIGICDAHLDGNGEIQVVVSTPLVDLP